MALERLPYFIIYIFSGYLFIYYCLPLLTFPLRNAWLGFSIHISGDQKETLVSGYCSLRKEFILSPCAMHPPHYAAMRYRQSFIISYSKSPGQLCRFVPCCMEVPRNDDMDCGCIMHGVDGRTHYTAHSAICIAV